MSGRELERLFLKGPRNLLQSVSRGARRGIAAPCRVIREPYKNPRIAVGEFYSGQTSIPLMEWRLFACVFLWRFVESRLASTRTEVEVLPLID
jgi:hypothetical protein